MTDAMTLYICKCIHKYSQTSLIRTTLFRHKKSDSRVSRLLESEKSINLENAEPCSKSSTNLTPIQNMRRSLNRESTTLLCVDHQLFCQLTLYLGQSSIIFASLLILWFMGFYCNLFSIFVPKPLCRSRTVGLSD